MILYGCAVGWTASGIVNLQKPDSPIPLSRLEITLIPAFFELGRFSSAIPAGLLGDKFGRKPIIYLCSVQHLLAWSLKILASSKYCLYFARFISGTAVGTGNAVLFIYAGEVSPPQIRGTVFSILYSCYYFGILFQFVIGAYLDYDLICFVSLGVCALFFAFFLFIKESPNYLLIKSREAEAKKVYRWIHKGRPEEEQSKEFDALKEYVSNQEKNRKGMITELSDPVNHKCVALVFNINFLTQLTGLPTVVVFVQTVFKKVNVLSPGEFSIIFAAIQFLAGCCASVLADKIGRRKMYMLTGTGCILSHAFTATLYFLSEDFGVEIPYASWLLLISISLYACIYAAGLGPLTVIVRGELLPQTVKGIGSGLAVVSAGISCFLLIFIFHNVEHYLGLAYNFIIFTINSALLMTLVYFKLPETKKKTLAEIQEAFQRSRSSS